MPATADSRRLLDALDEPALLVRGGQVTAANPAANALFGRRVPGNDVRLAIRHPEALALIQSGRAEDREITGIGGAQRPWTLSVRPLGDGTVLVRLVDRSAARAAEQMRVDFVANASHELRTPLTTITGYAETIAEDGELEPGGARKFGIIIRNEARRMLRIVEDLMSLSRIEADRFVVPAEPVDIGEVIAATVEHSAAVAAERGCTVSAEAEPGLPRVAGDRGQLLQLVDNLLSNAIRYGCVGRGCSVCVSAAIESDSVRLTIRDSGQGIAPGHLPRLTERFYRVDAARSRDSGGTGLGLAIVKHIVERHRGTLDIASRLGEGTTVEVRLPVAR